MKMKEVSMEKVIEFIKSNLAGYDPESIFIIHCSKCYKNCNKKVSELLSGNAFLENHWKHGCFIRDDFGLHIDIPKRFEELEPNPTPPPIPNPTQTLEAPEPKDPPLDDPKPDPQEELTKEMKLDSVEDGPCEEMDNLPMSGDTEPLFEVHIDPLGEGWIKLYRKIMDNPIFKDSEAYHLFSYLLLKANHKPNKFLFNKNEILVERGQLITGREQISRDTGISQWKVRSRLKLLENLHMITIKTTSKFSIITVCNYNRYQEVKVEEPPAKPPAKGENSDLTQGGSKSPANHQQPTTNKKYKKLLNNGRSKKTDPRVSGFLNWWIETHLQKIGVSYFCNFAKDGEIAKKLLLTFDLPDLKQYAIEFLKGDDQGERLGFTIGVFSQAVNRIAQRNASDPIERIKREERLRMEKEGTK
jgi:hypothetical protein